MTDLIVEPQTSPLVGSVPVPSDKSIGHRALLFGALCHGTSRISGFAGGEDNVATRKALEAMGVVFEGDADELRVRGVGLFGLRAPSAPLDCGNSGTTMRLLCGLLAPQPFATILVGDASLSGRPMMRVIAPLRARGAVLDGRPHPTKADVTAPLRIEGLPEGTYLLPLEYELPVASAQVKSALLLSGLYAHGPTTLREPTLSRDHTERMMLGLGVPLRTMGSMVELDPGASGWRGSMPAFDIALPGDVSAAAFLLAAGLVVPGSRISIRRVGSNPTRSGIFDILRAMGAPLGIEPLGETAGEPIANLHLANTENSLSSTLIAGELIPRAIDEIPALCVIAARTHGTTTVADAAELRVKESDRINAMTEVLRAFGVECDPKPDGIVIQGTSKPLHPADIDSRGDHRIAMSAAVLALAAEGPSRITNADCIQTSFPRFVGTLRALGANIRIS